jgi:glycine reductase
MVREIENATGIPVVQIATIVPIMLTVGTNRIVPGVAIPHPLGDPEAGPEKDLKKRRELLTRAFGAMQTEISEQTIFED